MTQAKVSSPHLYTRSTPPLSLGLLEFRAIKDLVTLPVRLASMAIKDRQEIGKGRHVMVLPGFGASDKTMFPLRYFLKQYGFTVIGWGLGVNKAGLDIHHDPTQISWDLNVPERYKGEAGVPYLSDLVIQKVRDYAESKSIKISLVGWSLGGTIAREVARDLPDIIDQVVTLGSPIIGGPKYTRAAPFLRQRGLNLDWIEQEVERRNSKPINCKVSAIVSKTDGVVDWSASVNPTDTETYFIERDVAHLGMCINQLTMDLVLKELTGGL
jgi:hypothetical protein